MQPTCVEVFQWHKHRLERQTIEGSKKEKELAQLSLTLLPRTKSVFMKTCKNDPARSFYKDEEDYNKKMGKLDKIMKTVDYTNISPEKMAKVQEKIDKIFLT